MSFGCFPKSCASINDISYFDTFGDIHFKFHQLQDMEEGEPKVKRKECYTKGEALQKLEALSSNVAKVVDVNKLVNSCSHLLAQVQLLLTSAPLIQQTKIWRSMMTS